MFGGTGIYVDEVFCAIVTGSGRFYLRVDDAKRSDFEAEGMEQFPGRGDSLMPYFEVPAHVLEDARELEGWVGRARAAAQAAGSKKRRR
jgi:DNA transformation protein